MSSPSKTLWKTLEESYEVILEAVNGVPSEGWAAPTPCSEWNVAQVVEHAAIDQLLYVSTVTNGPKPEGDAFAPNRCKQQIDDRKCNKGSKISFF